MPPQRILPGQFMHQPKEIREYLSRMWDLPRSGISEIRDQEVVSDGHTYEDLAVITLQKMTEYIGSEESFARAWELTCMKAHYELHPPVGVIGATKEERIPTDEMTGAPTTMPPSDDSTTDVYLEKEPTKGTFETLKAKGTNHAKEIKGE